MVNNDYVANSRLISGENSRYSSCDRFNASTQPIFPSFKIRIDPSVISTRDGSISRPVSVTEHRGKMLSVAILLKRKLEKLRLGSWQRPCHHS